MKYASIFFTVLVSWIAFILIVAFMPSNREVFQLYVLMVGFTIGLFLIGFGRK